MQVSRQKIRDLLREDQAQRRDEILCRQEQVAYSGFATEEEVIESEVRAKAHQRAVQAKQSAQSSGRGAN
jgi:hypothetical protein